MILGILLIPAALAFLAVLLRPVVGAYLVLGIGPLIVGIPRPDGALPLRPNEALLLLVIMALGLRSLLLLLSHRYRPPPFDRMDSAFLLLVAASSVVPLTSRSARGLPLSQDDLLYALVMAKYYIVFRLFRHVVMTEAQVTRCLLTSMAAAAVVAIVAMSQVLHIFGVTEFLQTYYNDPFNDVRDFTDRGTSTLALSFGVADLMIMNFAIALALCRSAKTQRPVLLCAPPVFLAGCVVAGEVSAYIGFATAFLAFAVLTRSLRRSLRVLLLGAFVALPFWPVVERRFTALDGQAGGPSSWDVRWWNLTHIFLPRLAADSNWLLGVEPAGRVEAPAGYIWGHFIYIESGYVWLLWTGGVPLMLAFFYFIYVAGRRLWQIIREMDGSPTGVAATAAFCFLTAMVMMMLFDPHLTMRGSADLFFPLLAVSFVPLAGKDRTKYTPSLGPRESCAIQSRRPQAPLGWEAGVHEGVTTR